MSEVEALRDENSRLRDALEKIERLTQLRITEREHEANRTAVSALETRGFVVVPAQPTWEMREAADNCEPYATYYATGETIYRAMVTAAQEDSRE